MSDEVRALIADWHRRCRQSQRVQYDCGNHYSRLHALIGGTTIILAVVVSTGVFVSLNREQQLWLRVTTSFLSVAAIVMASLQTFLRYEQRANRYRTDSAKYGALRRTLEQLMATASSDDEAKTVLTQVKSAMDELAANSQTIPSRVKRKAVKDLSSQPRKNALFRSYDIANGKQAPAAMPAPKNSS